MGAVEPAPIQKMKKRRWLVVSLVTSAIVLAVFASVALPLTKVATVFDAAPTAPTDAEMIAHWEKHRATLDEITEMLREDPALNRLGMTWSDPSDAERARMEPERLAKYRALMKQAGIISFGRGHRSIHFLYFTGGSSVNGFGKSFVRGEASRHAEIVDSDLDAAVGGRKKLLLQRPIGEGWWLQRDSS